MLIVDHVAQLLARHLILDNLIMLAITQLLKHVGICLNSCKSITISLRITGTCLTMQGWYNTDFYLLDTAYLPSKLYTRVVDSSPPRQVRATQQVAR